MSMDDTRKRVQDHLKNKCRVASMTVPREWIDGCVAFYRNSHSNTNLNALLEFVAQQWFLVDFETIKLRSLPVNLSKSALVNLNENYVLQLMSVLNIGQSAYSQHTKITQGLDNNSEVSADKKIPSKWEPKVRRMLRLELTDGSQSVQAIEYKAINHLHLDLIPGTKILIKGPVECRRGVILLRPNNVELLGGEVSDLVQKNAPENVLARLIGKPENPNPVYGSYTEQTAAINDVEQDGDDEFSSAKCSSGKESRPTAHQRKGGGNCGGPTSANLNHRHQGPSSVTARGNTTTTTTTTANVKREKKRSLDDCDQHPHHKASGGSSSSYPPAKKMVQNVKKDEEDLFPDDDDDYIFHTAAAVEEKEEEEEKDVVDMFPDDDDDILFTDMSGPPSAVVVPTDDPATATTTTTTTTAKTEQQGQVKISGAAAAAAAAAAGAHAIEKPFTYLSSHLRKRANNVKCQQESICVKGFVSTITGKLAATKSKTGVAQWQLSAVINDGSAGLKVDFSPQVLEELIGHSPAALKSMMAVVGDDNKRRGLEVLEEAKQKLIRLNCLLHIRWPAAPDDADCAASNVMSRREVGIPATSHKLPVVYRLEDIERRHLEMLQLL